MNAKYCVLILLVTLTSCVHFTDPAEKKEINYASLEASLCNINQKLKSYYLTRDIPNDFDASQYKAVVNEICSSNSVCRSQIQELFASYDVEARKIDGTFSLMLCDIDRSRKIMEDFGCNSMLVEIKNWKEGDAMLCKFEDNWQHILQQHCRE